MGNSTCITNTLLGLFSFTLWQKICSPSGGRRHWDKLLKGVLYFLLRYLSLSPPVQKRLPLLCHQTASNREPTLQCLQHGRKVTKSQLSLSTQNYRSLCRKMSSRKPVVLAWLWQAFPLRWSPELLRPGSQLAFVADSLSHLLHTKYLWQSTQVAGTFKSLGTPQDEGPVIPCYHSELTCSWSVSQVVLVVGQETKAMNQWASQDEGPLTLCYHSESELTCTWSVSQVASVVGEGDNLRTNDWMSLRPQKKRWID